MIRDWNVLTGRPVFRIQPNDIHPDLLGTGDIHLQAVADKEGFRRLKVHAIQSGLEDFTAGLSPTDLGRDQDLLEEIPYPFAFQDPVDRGGMVKIGDKTDLKALAALSQQLAVVFGKLQDPGDLIGMRCNHAAQKRFCIRTRIEIQPRKNCLEALFGGDFLELLVPYQMDLTGGLAQDGIKLIKRDLRMGRLKDIIDQTAGGPDRLPVHCDQGKLGEV